MGDAVNNNIVRLALAVWVVSCWAIAAGAEDAPTAASPGGKVNKP